MTADEFDYRAARGDLRRACLHLAAGVRLDEAHEQLTGQATVDADGALDAAADRVDEALAAFRDAHRRVLEGVRDGG